MTILFKCDVQVAVYRGEVVSQAANHLQVSFWTAVHPIQTADSHFYSPPSCSFLPFSPLCPPCNFQILRSYLRLLSFALSVNAQKHPWTLAVRRGQDQTKSRAGAARERSFSKVQTRRQEEFVSVQRCSCPKCVLSFVVTCCSSLVQCCLYNCK